VTPLHLAAANGSLQVVAALVDAGAVIDAQDKVIHALFLSTNIDDVNINSKDVLPCTMRPSLTACKL
jgi:ankyrin repeat protein